MAYVLSNSHVTGDVTWPPKVLSGSTVGYPSDSLAFCSTSCYPSLLWRCQYAIPLGWISICCSSNV